MKTRIIMMVILAMVVCLNVYSMEIEGSQTMGAMIGHELYQEINETCIDGYKFVIITSYMKQFGHIVKYDTPIDVQVKQVFGNVRDPQTGKVYCNAPINCDY